jgi:hypothetical protein
MSVPIIPAEFGSSGASAANGWFQMLVGLKNWKLGVNSVVVAAVVPSVCVAGLLPAVVLVPAAAVVVVVPVVGVGVAPTGAEGALSVGGTPADVAIGARVPPAVVPAGGSPGLAGAAVCLPLVECRQFRALDRLWAER